MMTSNDGGVTANVVVCNALEFGGPRVRGVCMCVCRDWRNVAKEEMGWRVEFERRWWHLVCFAPTMWRRRFASRILAEQSVLRLFERLESSDDKTTATSLEELATNGEEDLREMLASVGSLLGSESCTRQFVSFGDRLRSPPTLASRKKFIACASARAARRLDARDSRLALYATSALAAASSQFAWPDYRQASLDAGFSTISSCLRVFFDEEGVELELKRLARMAREARRSERKDDDSIMNAVEEVFVREKFVGNSDDYYDAQNSLIDAVLERRLGIPISLAAVFDGIATRAGLSPGRLSPVNYPGHFFLEYKGDNDQYLLDVFSPRPYEPLRHCNAQLLTTFAPVRFPPALPHDVWRRALRNLFNIYQTEREQDSLFKALTLHLGLDQLTQETTEFVAYNRIKVALSHRVDDTLLLPRTVREELVRISTPFVLDSRGNDVMYRTRHLAARALNIHYAGVVATRRERENVEEDDETVVS